MFPSAFSSAPALNFTLAGADEISQRVGAVVRQPAVFRDLFYLHIIKVESDDILISFEAVSESFIAVGGCDGAVRQLLLHPVCFPGVSRR